MVPIRTAVAIGSLVPLPVYGGLALVQVFMIYSIGIGIGFADTAWEKMVTSLISNKTPISAPLNDPAIGETVKGMLMSKICILTLEGNDGHQKGDALTRNYYEATLGKNAALSLKNNGASVDGSRISYVVESAETLDRKSPSFKHYTWYLGAVDKRTKNGNAAQGSAWYTAQSVPADDAVCGKIEFDSGTVPDLAGKINNLTGGMKDGFVTQKFDIVKAIAIRSKNGVTQNNRARMISMWNDKRLNDLALKIVHDDEKNKLNPADYASLQAIVSDQQRSVNQDLKASGIGATPDLEAQLIKMMTAEGSIMAGSFYWTLNRLQNSMDKAVLASSPTMIKTNEIQDAYAAGNMAKTLGAGGVGLLAVGLGVAALSAPVALGVGVVGLGMAAFGITLEQNNTGDVAIAKGVYIARGDMGRMGVSIGNAIRFFNKVETLTGSSVSGATVGNALKSVRNGSSSTNDLVSESIYSPSYWQGKKEKDWDERAARWISDAIREGSNTAVNNIDVNGNTVTSYVRSDPMREMRFLGNSMLTLSAGLAGMSIAATVVPISKISAAAKVVTGGENTVSLVVGVVLLALQALGLVLAFIIPALPYTTWTLSLLTYLIVFAEAMIASLFWALAHAWPEGDGAASSLAGKGWMLYLQVMMTPILMLGGFFIGIQLVYIMGWWVDNTLFSTLSDAFAGDSATWFGGSMGIFGAVGMLMIYTGLMLAIVWKSFDVVAELKNWVFEWIGGSARSMGENQAQQQHIMGVVGGAQSAANNYANRAAHSQNNTGGDTTKKSKSKTINSGVK